MMKGQVALVTGASHGIGSATAKLLAANGASVAVNYFQSESAALAIASDHSRFVTGCYVPVSGGLLML